VVTAFKILLLWLLGLLNRWETVKENREFERTRGVTTVAPRCGKNFAEVKWERPEIEQWDLGIICRTYLGQNCEK